MVTEKWLAQKTIVVIGGTTGIGLSAASAFIRHGAQVVVVGRNPESCDDAQRQLGSSAVVISADATHESTAPHAIAQAIHTFGSFDGLYHVAGGSGRKFGDGPLHELTLES